VTYDWRGLGVNRVADCVGKEGRGLIRSSQVLVWQQHHPALLARMPGPETHLHRNDEAPELWCMCARCGLRGAHQSIVSNRWEAIDWPQGLESPRSHKPHAPPTTSLDGGVAPTATLSQPQALTSWQTAVTPVRLCRHVPTRCSAVVMFGPPPVSTTSGPCACSCRCVM
jgi:hypothetical protein